MWPTNGFFLWQVVFLIVVAVVMPTMFNFSIVAAMIRPVVVRIRVVGVISTLIFVIVVVMLWIYVSLVL